MNRKIFWLVVALIICSLPSHAVLKEDSLNNTLSILRQELTQYHKELTNQSDFMKQQQQRVQQELVEIVNRSNQNALMLYSQKPDYIFDLTYACHEATEQYMQFQKNVTPFKVYIERTSNEIARYDSLIVNLSQMYTQGMTWRARTDRNVCLTLAVNIRHTLQENNKQLEQYINIYKVTEQHLKYLNDYANRRYADIQSSIFRNGGKNYVALLSQLGTQLKETRTAVAEKYRPYYKVRSQWDSRIILFLLSMIVLYSLVAVGINIVSIRFLMPQRFRTPSFMAKRSCIILATSAVTLALILGLVRIIFKDQNFVIMASGLLVQYAWLLSAIMISLLLRLEGTQIMSAFRIYSPLIVIGFTVITFRIVLIPNDLVELIFPPILLVCLFWQWSCIRRHGRHVPRVDQVFSYASLAVFVVSTLCSWIGYTLLSVQVLIWWIMQLMCILTITCIKDYLGHYAERHGISQKPMDERWLFAFVYEVVLPVLGVLSIILSIYWAADVFNLSDTTWMIFNKNYIAGRNFSASIAALAQVVILYFVFRYINRTVKALLALHFAKSDASTAASRSVMAKNALQVLVWGVWVLVSMSIFQMNNSWIGYMSVGLTTGIGFASKDILENFYYGISLMAGRIKIGDYIECDGIRGKVSSISYTSTMIEAIDGSVIAFQNSQLFTKNYKNMTKNHGYQLDVLEVGVAYGTDIDMVKNLLVGELSKLDCIHPGKPPKVVLRGFADSCVTLKILVWVPVLTQYYDDGRVLECVYRTLNEHHIEIPFPQRDVHIIHGTQE